MGNEQGNRVLISVGNGPAGSPGWASQAGIAGLHGVVFCAFLCIFAQFALFPRLRASRRREAEPLGWLGFASGIRNRHGTYAREGSQGLARGKCQQNETLDIKTRLPW